MRGCTARGVKKRQRRNGSCEMISFAFQAEGASKCANYRHPFHQIEDQMLTINEQDPLFRSIHWEKKRQMKAGYLDSLLRWH